MLTPSSGVLNIALPSPLSNWRRIRCHLRAGLAGLGLGLMALAASAGLPITIEVQANQPSHPVNPKLLGSNTPWVYGSEGLVQENGDWRPAMIRQAREIAPTLLRYPGTPDTYDCAPGAWGR